MANQKKDSPSGLPHLAICSVPMQPWETLYPLEDGLKNGTIFPSLNKVFFAGEKVGGEKK